MRKTIAFLSIVVILGLTGCAPKNYLQESMNKHGNSLYTYKKDPSQENRENHIKTLEKIISRSQLYGRIVPPGIYAEYGFFLLKNDPMEAKKCFLIEKELYPEAAVFIDNLLYREGLVESRVGKK